MVDSITGTLSGGEQPMLRVPFARVGAWRHPSYGDIVLDNPTLERMKANFDTNAGGSRPFIRVGHDNSKGKSRFGDEPALAWIEDIQIENDVAFALARPTSPDAVQLVKEGRYRYSSMEFDRDHTPRDGAGKKRPDPIGPVLFAVALTNEPFLTHLPEAQITLALAQPDTDMVFALDYGEPKGEPMVDEQALVDRFLARLAQSFGFKADADAPEPKIDPPKPDAAADAARLAAEQAATERLAVAETARAVAEAALAAAQHATHVSTIEARLTKAQHDGVAPAMLAALRPLLISADSLSAVPCAVTAADGTEGVEEKPMVDVLLSVLEAYPADKRISFGSSGKTAETTDREARLAAARATANQHRQPGQLMVSAN